MRGGKRNTAIVSRDYRLALDDCVRALELLLKKSVRKEGGPATAPDDAERNLSDSASNHSTG